MHGLQYVQHLVGAAAVEVVDVEDDAVDAPEAVGARSVLTVGSSGTYPVELLKRRGRDDAGLRHAL